MNRATRSFVFALLAFVAATWLVCNPRRPEPGTPVSSATPSAPSSAAAAEGAVSAKATDAAPAASKASAPSPGFRSDARLREHFEKHGQEFEASSKEAYLAMAQALRDAPPSSDLLELVRPLDGVVNRFDRKTGAFIAYDPDGTIRTFFKPDDGEAYFRRQARRAPR